MLWCWSEPEEHTKLVWPCSLLQSLMPTSQVWHQCSAWTNEQCSAQWPKVVTPSPSAQVAMQTRWSHVYISNNVLDPDWIYWLLLLFWGSWNVKKKGGKNIDRVPAPQGQKVGTNKLEGRRAVYFTVVLKWPVVSAISISYSVGTWQHCCSI